MVSHSDKMPEDDVVYSDIKFTKSEEKATCYRLQAGSNGGSKVTWERAAIAVLSALLTAAVIALVCTSYKNLQTMEYLQQLTALNKNLSERRCEVKTHNTMQEVFPGSPVVNATEPCSKCPQGWELSGGRCYRFSTDRSPWEKARGECRSQGGDLVQIDSRMEQSFLVQRVSEKMNNPEDKFWIGLTDSEEGRWLWVDGSPLNTSLTFWYNTEPDNWTDEDPDGEDCVRMGERGQPGFLMCWLDKSCKVPHRHICEKQAETGQLKCV
uniref:immune-related, lectin-like receptor 4 isoform X3 n=1 Tax=Scatophagus argus TaxID=75038 RepID=UPI001ED857B3|nr:immune-related, lectin-like receptor 4 isoform X3 [Scatophagus argus]